jgi:hypothetical protein
MPDTGARHRPRRGFGTAELFDHDRNDADGTAGAMTLTVLASASPVISTARSWMSLGSIFGGGKLVA